MYCACPVSPGTCLLVGEGCVMTGLIRFVGEVAFFWCMQVMVSLEQFVIASAHITVRDLHLN